jgi:H-NS histone family
MKGRKVPVKYRDKAGNTWAGRGAQPVWLREASPGRRSVTTQPLPGSLFTVTSPPPRRAFDAV